MFDESYTKLDLNEVAVIIDEVNKQVDGSIFDPLETTILAIDVPFYPNYRFLDIADHATNPPLKRYAFQKKGTLDFVLLDWTYKTIYALNLEAPIVLNEGNVFEYIRFFFSHVKGRHGRFIICESADNIQWKDEPPAEIRKSLNQALEPLKIVEKRKDGVYHITGCMMLKDAMFKAEIYVEPNGRVTMTDHQILVENVPVVDSVTGQ